MKSCPICRTPYPYANDFKFCTKDGAVLANGAPSGFTSKQDTLPLPDSGFQPQDANHEGVLAQYKTTEIFTCPDKWLHDIAEYETARIQKFVLVEDCTIESSYLSKGKHYVDFTFSILNLSIYTVSIPMSQDAVIEGSIHFKGEPLSRGAKLINNQAKYIKPTGYEGYFVIRQWVDSVEAKDISDTLKISGNLFDFSNAIVYIRSDEFPNAKAMKLDLTRGMQNTDLKNRIIQLEALNSHHVSEISDWRKHADIIHRLSIVHGMALQAEHTINFFHGSLSEDELKYLDSHINSTIHHCFGAQVRDNYYKNMKPLPSSTDAQSWWIRAHCADLEVLIKQQGQLIERKPTNQS